jgi:2-polyprenyl-3-methyl-5-hydroxy-6-metoxy-1,4-benzoquinol methylase
MAIEVDADEGLCIDTETDLDVAETILARNPKQTLRIDQSKNAVVDAPVEQMFNSTWVSRPESEYVHWTRGELTNQIQLVFRNHWELFSQIMQRNRGDGLRSLEVGCGRGSLSCYFADAGYEVTLLDSSPSVLETAKEIYSRNGVSGFFHAGDALSMPFESESFDVVFSIGLLEHFDNIQSLVAEQARVLRPGGYLFIYTVPDKEVRVQDEFSWVNDLLSSVLPQSSQTNTKPVLYRNKILGSSYVEILNEMGFKNAQSSGVYPLPMISNSLDFPFTIMSPACEEVLVRTFNKILNRRAAEGGGHPWLCAEDYGQAILIWGTR